MKSFILFCIPAPTKSMCRSAKLGIVHTVLNRPEEKYPANRKPGEATSACGGKRKRYYTVTNTGKVALLKAKEVRDNLWSMIPNMSLKISDMILIAGSWKGAVNRFVTAYALLHIANCVLPVSSRPLSFH
jgi:hypothetical protein